MQETHHMTRIEPADTGKPCGHAHHVGTCPSCQRAQLNRWHMQLIQVKPARPADG
jgi:hypothetical protein